jgi:hypothetical protein
MKKADLIYKKIENFLIVNGCEAWQNQKGCFIAPNGHRFSCETSAGIIAIFHRDSEWGKKSNYFVLISDNMALEKALCFIDHNIRMRG